MSLAGISTSRSARAAVFCACLVLPCLAVLLGLPFVVRTGWFAKGANFTWVPTRDYPYEVSGMDADVVVFGDSSALAGIDPRLLQKQLGVSAVNLSPILRSLSMMRDKPLAAYLRHNKAPRLIVVYVAPWNTGTAPDEASTDGLIVMLRHGTMGDVLHWLVKHPVQMLNAEIFLADLTLGRIGHPSHASAHDAAWQARGFLPYPGNLPHLGRDCAINPSYSVPPDAGSWPQTIMDRYQNSQTRVVLYLAPLPDCTGTSRFVDLQSRLRPQAINRVQLLSPDLFLDDNLYAHPEERNVPVTTQMLSDALRPLLAAQDGPAIAVTPQTSKPSSAR